MILSDGYSNSHFDFIPILFEATQNKGVQGGVAPLWGLRPYTPQYIQLHIKLVLGVILVRRRWAEGYILKVCGASLSRFLTQFSPNSSFNGTPVDDFAYGDAGGVAENVYDFG